MPPPDRVDRVDLPADLADRAVREVAAWVWYPVEATVLEAPDHLLVRWPDWHGVPPALLRWEPPARCAGVGPDAIVASVQDTLDRALEQAGAWGAEELSCTVALGAPAELEERAGRLRLCA